MKQYVAAQLLAFVVSRVILYGDQFFQEYQNWKRLNGPGNAQSPSPFIRGAELSLVREESKREEESDEEAEALNEESSN